jgi:hypothetical protein
MYDIHTTGNGDTLLICCMTDDHLLNTIRSLSTKIQTAVEVLTSPQLDDPLIAVFQPKFSKAAMQDKAKENLEFLHERLQPYVMEAALRGLEITLLLQSTYGRSAGVPMRSSRLLEASVDPEIDAIFPL